MRKSLHLKIFCTLLFGLSWTGCQLGGDEPITSTLGFRDVPTQSEPPVETEDEIESRQTESMADE
ncbi:hypothetical protein [uncultured Gimesia sp.]|uniref:hypothetical protein n=1 Tax=uncultured Gimesia sp. TaxID=1678688 RepID=UPI0030D764E9